MYVALQSHVGSMCVYFSVNGNNLRYGDSVDNTVEENSSVFSLI